MTLAAILIVSLLVADPAALSEPVLGIGSEAFLNQASQNQTGNAPQSGSTGAESQGQTTSQSPTATSAGKQKTSKNGKRKRQAAIAPVECPAANAASGASVGSAASASTQTAGSTGSTNQGQTAGSQTPASGSATNSAVSGEAMPNQGSAEKGATKTGASGVAAQENCPPTKTVVREGGTTDSAIQLVGGKGIEQASQQRSSTDQLLDSTADNLKKVSGRQLTPSQQEMVNQIHAFIQQSKAAVSAGDIERGHTLAQKAHLLSDELVKP